MDVVAHAGDAAVLQSVLDQDPRHIAACLTLAGLYRDAHLPARAKSPHRKVLAIEPDHAEALQALAELEPPPEPAPAPSGLSGLFRRR